MLPDLVNAEGVTIVAQASQHTSIMVSRTKINPTGLSSSNSSASGNLLEAGVVCESSFSENSGGNEGNYDYERNVHA